MLLSEISVFLEAPESDSASRSRLCPGAAAPVGRSDTELRVV